MEALSVREYRNNLAASFDRAAEGERVIIRRKNKLYALVSLGKDQLVLNKEQQEMLDGLAASLRRSWEEVKQIETGIIESKSAMSFLDED
ncbi:MAG: type II toxin-antitoxin system Phd/YefM family antitoxin [Bacteroides sp.]|nr:type II toxin-antitoxin system Phd/YefM family antitoxin [Bacteroides sp.]